MGQLETHHRCRVLHRPFTLASVLQADGLVIPTGLQVTRVRLAQEVHLIPSFAEGLVSGAVFLELGQNVLGSQVVLDGSLGAGQAQFLQQGPQCVRHGLVDGDTL